MADVRTEIGRRYAIVFGIDLRLDRLPQVRIILADSSTSQARKYALDSASPSSSDMIEFVTRFF